VRRDRPSRSTKAGNRGRHRHVDSPETKRWLELEREVAELFARAEALEREISAALRRSIRERPTLDLVGGDTRAAATAAPSQDQRDRRSRRAAASRPPLRPSWLDPDEYEALLELRTRLR
jgi:hypothetical protein